MNAKQFTNYSQIQRQSGHDFYITNIDKMILKTYLYNIIITAVVCVLAIATKLKHRIDPSFQQYIDGGSMLVLTVLTIYQTNAVCVSTWSRRIMVMMYCGICLIARQHSKTTLFWLLIASLVMFVLWTQKDNVRAKAIEPEFNQMCYGKDTFDGLSRVTTHQCQTVTLDDNYNSNSIVRLKLMRLMLKLELDTLHLETVRKLPFPTLLTVIRRRMALYNITASMLDKKPQTFLSMLMEFIDDHPFVRSKLIPQRTSSMSTERLFVLMYGFRFDILTASLMDGKWDPGVKAGVEAGVKAGNTVSDGTSATPTQPTPDENHDVKTRIAMKVLFDIDGPLFAIEGKMHFVNNVLRQFNMSLDDIRTLGCLRFIYLVCVRMLGITIQEKQLFAMEQRSIMALVAFAHHNPTQVTSLDASQMDCYNIHIQLKLNGEADTKQGNSFANRYDDVYQATEIIRDQLQKKLAFSARHQSPIPPVTQAGKRQPILRSTVLQKSTQNPQIGGTDAASVGAVSAASPNTPEGSLNTPEASPLIPETNPDDLVALPAIQDNPASQSSAKINAIIKKLTTPNTTTPTNSNAAILNNLSSVQKSILVLSLELGLPISTPLMDDNFRKMHDRVMDKLVGNITDDEPGLLYSMDVRILKLIPVVRKIGKAAKIRKLANMNGQDIACMSYKRFLCYIGLLVEGKPYNVSDLIDTTMRDKILILEQKNHYINMEYVRKTSLQDIEQQIQWRSHNVYLTPLMYKTVQQLNQQCSIGSTGPAGPRTAGPRTAVHVDQLVGLSHCQIVLIKLACSTNVDSDVAINAVHVRGKLPLIIVLQFCGAIREPTTQDEPTVTWDIINIASVPRLLNILKTHMWNAKRLDAQLEAFSQLIEVEKENDSEDPSHAMLRRLYHHYTHVLVIHDILHLNWLQLSHQPHDATTLDELSHREEKRCKLALLDTFLTIMLQYLLDAFHIMYNHASIDGSIDGPMQELFGRFIKRGKQLTTTTTTKFDPMTVLIGECLHEIKIMLLERLLFPRYVVDKLLGLDHPSLQQLLLVIVLQPSAQHIVQDKQLFHAFVDAVLALFGPGGGNGPLVYLAHNPDILSTVTRSNARDVLLKLQQNTEVYPDNQSATTPTNRPATSPDNQSATTPTPNRLATTPTTHSAVRLTNNQSVVPYTETTPTQYTCIKGWTLAIPVIDFKSNHFI